MKIIKMYTPLSKARSGNKLNNFNGVTIHATGNPKIGAHAVAHAIYLLNDGKNKTASWHYCVDENIITQSIPEDEIAWHAGDGKGDGNYKTISIEICVNADGDILEATDNAAELAADILKRHKITTAEGNVFQHNHWSGKNCPQHLREGIPYGWDTFIMKVNGFLQDEEEEFKITRKDGKKIIQDICKFDDNTMKYLDSYFYRNELIIRLAQAMIK